MLQIILYWQWITTISDKIEDQQVWLEWIIYLCQEIKFKDLNVVSIRDSFQYGKFKLFPRDYNHHLIVSMNVKFVWGVAKAFRRTIGLLTIKSQHNMRWKLSQIRLVKFGIQIFILIICLIYINGLLYLLSFLHNLFPVILQQLLSLTVKQVIFSIW